MFNLCTETDTKLLTCIVVIMAVAVSVRGFCPSGCHCDDVKLTVYCVSAKLNIVPILLNPGTTGLDLSYNVIHKFNMGFAFYRSLITLNLSNNVIETLGSNNFASQNSLVKLILNNNKLSEIKAHAFAGLLELNSLDLSQNFISNIEKESFRSLDNLNSLDLSFNGLEKLEADMFDKLLSLKTLNLCNNDLKNITKGLFGYLKNIKEINLCSNSIEIIADGAFVKQNTLRVLVLRQNKLFKLDQNSFLGLSSLISLDLQSNMFNKIPSDELRHLTQLEKLILGNSAFEKISSGTLAAFTNLKNLQISNSEKLRFVESNAFYNLTKLHRLELSYNHKLKNLPTNIFAGLTNLKHLILRGNQLSTLKIDMVNMSSVLSLDLRENNFECNCSLKWLNTLLKVHNSSLLVEDVKCSSPESLENRRMRDLDDYDLKCYSHILFIVSTASAAVVLLVLVVISTYFYFIKCKKLKSIVQDTWPKKIVTTWNGSNLDKRMQDEEYTFQTRQTFSQTRTPVLWQDISASATREDFSSDAYASTTASTPQDEYRDYRDPVFVSMTANKIKSKFCSTNPHKYKTITRSYTDSTGNIKHCANSPKDFVHLPKIDRSRDSAISMVSSSPYEQQIFSIANGSNHVTSFQNGDIPQYHEWKCFESKFARSVDILDKDTNDQHRCGILHKAPKNRTWRQNGSAKKSISNDRIFTLGHLYSLPKRPDFGYERDTLYDNII